MIDASTLERRVLGRLTYRIIPLTLERVKPALHSGSA
jgi:hypothetical protein